MINERGGAREEFIGGGQPDLDRLGIPIIRLDGYNIPYMDIVHIWCYFPLL